MVADLEECCYVIDGFIRSVQKICVRWRNVEKIIGSSILDILHDYLQL